MTSNEQNTDEKRNVSYTANEPLVNNSDLPNVVNSKVAKSYDFFRKGEFFEPTGSVSKAKIGAVIRVLESLGDLPSHIDVDKLFLPGVTRVVD